MTQPIPKSKSDHTVLCVQTWMVHGDTQSFVEAFVPINCRLPSEALDIISQEKVDAVVFYISSHADYHELVQIRTTYPSLPILVMKADTSIQYKDDMKFKYVDVHRDITTKELSALLENNMSSAYKLVGAL